MKTVARYDLINFVKPESWPYPYTVEQAFGVFRWLAETGGRRSFPLLSKKPTCVNFGAVDPIVSIADLAERFRYALLYDWHPKRLTRSIAIPFRHYKPFNGPESEHELKTGIDALLASAGMLTKSLNSCHRQAREIYGVRLHIGGYTPPYPWCFVLEYGFDSSVWHHTLAEQEPKEAFIDTYLRARAAMAELVRRPRKKVAG